MLSVRLKKRPSNRKPRIKNFANHEEYLARIAKSLYYVHVPLSNCTSLPVTELAAEIFSKSNKFSLNRLDIEKAARYTKNGCVSPCLLVLALLYLERLKSTNPKYLTKVSPTELFLVSLLVGSKFLQDDGEGEELNNTEWAHVTGLSVQEINMAEKEFLDAINWKVFVSQGEFWDTFTSLESKIGLREGSKRGWFTYTELNLLLQLIDITNVLQCLWNVTSACMLSYTASVLTLVGSALLVSQIPGLGLKPKVPISDIANNWTSPLPSAENVLGHSTGIQDCNISCSLELRTEVNITDPEFSRLCQPGYNFIINHNLESGTNVHYLKGFDAFMYFTPNNFLDVGNLIIEKSKYGSLGISLTRSFNVWTWSDYLNNFLLKDSVPRSFYSVASY